MSWPSFFARVNSMKRVCARRSSDAVEEVRYGSGIVDTAMTLAGRVDSQERNASAGARPGSFRDPARSLSPGPRAQKSQLDERETRSMVAHGTKRHFPVRAKHQTCVSTKHVMSWPSLSLV